MRVGLDPDAALIAMFVSSNMVMIERDRAAVLTPQQSRCQDTCSAALAAVAAVASRPPPGQAGRNTQHNSADSGLQLDCFLFCNSLPLRPPRKTGSAEEMYSLYSSVGQSGQGSELSFTIL